MPAIADGSPAQLLGDAVRSVMAGTPLTEAAVRHGLAAEDLAAAVETYHHGGATALQDRVADGDWWQAHLEFTAWDQAEHVAARHLKPHLHGWSIDGLLDRWWFIRKSPCWRVRLHPHPASSREALATTAAPFFNRMVADGHLTRWQSTHYEPETFAFGGPTGIAIAHDLFSADTTNLLAYLHAGETPLGRCELSLLLCTVLFRAARQEWFEAGDVWHRVTRLRPDPDHAGTDTGHHANLTAQLRTLLSYDTRLSGPVFGPGSPLATVRSWAEAFHNAGQALAAASQANLHRGLRAILAHHVIFHWNRLGLDASTQHALAHAAAGAILQHDLSSS